MRRLWLLGVLAACGGGDEEAATPPTSAREMAVTVAMGAGATVMMGTPLVASGDAVRLDGTPSEGEARVEVEAAVSGNSLVTPPTCASYAWTGLSASITFTACTIEATGTPLSGTIGLAVTLDPASIAVTLTALDVGGETYDGSMSLTFGGTDLMVVRTWMVDLTYTPVSGPSAHYLMATEVRPALQMVIVNGTGSVTAGQVARSATLTSVTWKTGECLPSAGSLEYMDNEVGLVKITFLAATPVDGTVTVEWMGFTVTQPYLEPLLALCP